MTPNPRSLLRLTYDMRGDTDQGDERWKAEKGEPLQELSAGEIRESEIRTGRPKASEHSRR